MNKRVAKAAYHCRNTMEARFTSILLKIEQELKEFGIVAECVTRPGEKHNSPFWPNRDVAIIIDLASLEQDGTHIEQALEVGNQNLSEGLKCCVVPTVNRKVIKRAVMERALGMNIPISDFAEKWNGHISASIPSDLLTCLFEDASSACISLSSITSCCGLNDYHDEETDLLDKLIIQFKVSRDRLTEVATETKNAIIEECCNYLDEMWNRWIDEREAIKAGQITDRPLCEDAYLSLNGENIEQINYFSNLLILLSETESTLDLSTFV